ncbi:MAG: hypothetical protein LBI43_05620 [Streptococcaceae bacterium]|jgi:hypothetical protein|nr:hypothetical protein [Streptococcaceae bacterium]
MAEKPEKSRQSTVSRFNAHLLKQITQASRIAQDRSAEEAREGWQRRDPFASEMPNDAPQPAIPQNFSDFTATQSNEIVINSAAMAQEELTQLQADRTNLPDFTLTKNIRPQGKAQTFRTPERSFGVSVPTPNQNNAFSEISPTDIDQSDALSNTISSELEAPVHLAPRDLGPVPLPPLPEENIPPKKQPHYKSDFLSQLRATMNARKPTATFEEASEMPEITPYRGQDAAAQEQFGMLPTPVGLSGVADARETRLARQHQPKMPMPLPAEREENSASAYETPIPSPADAEDFSTEAHEISLSSNVNSSISKEIISDSKTSEKFIPDVTEAQENALAVNSSSVPDETASVAPTAQNKRHVRPHDVAKTSEHHAQSAFLRKEPLFLISLAVCVIGLLLSVFPVYGLMGIGFIALGLAFGIYTRVSKPKILLIVAILAALVGSVYQVAYFKLPLLYRTLTASLFGSQWTLENFNLLTVGNAASGVGGFTYNAVLRDFGKPTDAEKTNLGGASTLTVSYQLSDDNTKYVALTFLDLGHGNYMLISKFQYGLT